MDTIGRTSGAVALVVLGAMGALGAEAPAAIGGASARPSACAEVDAFFRQLSGDR